MTNGLTLVQRLRMIDSTLTQDAADEIERLNERLETQKGVIANYIETERILNAEIERLQGETQRLQAMIGEIDRQHAAELRSAHEPKVNEATVTNAQIR